MSNFLIKVLINAIALGTTTWLLPGINVTTSENNTTQEIVLGYLLLGLIFGIINTLLKPIIKILTLPITCLTLGFFSLIINATMLWWTAKFSQNTFVKLNIENFWWTAILGAIIISIISTILNVSKNKKL